MACLLNTILKFFDFFEKARVYYNSNLIFNLFVKFDWRAEGLYMARIKIINNYGFEKVDIKNWVYINII